MLKFHWIIWLALALGGCSSEPAESSCTKPDPSKDCRTLGCTGDDECVLEPGGCLSSHCSCQDGDWMCTADCGEKYHCVSPGDVCQEPDPSKDCRDLGCEGNEVCLPEPEPSSCLPSTCFCESGTWSCTDDCGQRHTCQEPLACLGVNPSWDCQTTGCEEGETCEPSALAVCRPSTCECSDDGNWLCTRDCVAVHACVPSACAEPNPAGCTQSGCGEGEQCVRAPGECSPSQCFCDSGTWICTEDCGGGGTCVDAALACTTPNPAGCSQDGCGRGEICERADDECAPSECFCSEGSWVCTRDCGGGGVCVPAGTECADPNPAGCAQEGCSGGLTCVNDPDVCAPSRCNCAQGVWYCTRDCGGGGTCL